MTDVIVGLKIIAVEYRKSKYEDEREKIEYITLEGGYIIVLEAEYAYDAWLVVNRDE